LNKKYSTVYLEDSIYRERFSLLRSYDRQLSINLNSNNSGLETIITLCSNVHSLDLSNNDMTDVRAFGNICNLNLCRNLNLREVSSLNRIHALNLSHCRAVKNVIALRNANTLDLSYYINVTNVSRLGNVYNLNISHCIYIKDVSMLGGVHTLNLEKCTIIHDISALQNKAGECKKVPKIFTSVCGKMYLDRSLRHDYRFAKSKALGLLGSSKFKLKLVILII
jgi:hypothetical protein